MVLSMAHTTASYMYMKYAYIGYHVKDIPWNDPEVSRIWMYIINVLYNPILAIVKMSVLIFLLRLGGYKTGVRSTILAVGAVNLFMMIGCLIAMIFQCFPFEYNWRPWAVQGTCIDRPAYYVARAVLNVVTDIVVLIMPIWIFWDLKMNKKVRWALIFVFMLGFIATIVGCIRLWLLISPYLDPVEGADWSFSVGFTITAMEVNIAIWTACLPALWPLGRQWFPGLFSKIGLDSPHKARDVEPQMLFPLSGGVLRTRDFRRRSVTDLVAAYRQRFLKDGKQRMKVAPYLSVDDGEEEIQAGTSLTSTSGTMAVCRPNSVSAARSSH
ncbi:hypothetical protein MCOR25_003522 [Pyricularia grisea]|nr:hypothetical protein MCOR25_003522 [Pyricularia grisea]